MKKKRLRPKAMQVETVTPDEIRAWRSFVGYTQKEAADYLGVSTRSIENWEQGASAPQFSGAMRKLMQLAHPKWRWPPK